MAALLWAASACAAAPGHTAQPFRPTPSAGAFIKEAWDRDPLKLCRAALTSICPRHAKIRGKARKADAINVISYLHCDDLVIVDPPYSAAQYSRFYHVLETIARGNCGVVEGTGRYPSLQERPQSQFSNKGESIHALEMLLSRLARVRATVIFTFPAKVCSNGLSGRMIVNKAKTWFTIDKESIKGRFSTLGGNNSHRAARQPSRELLLLLRPK
jgi:adenine-specific DNA methylase